MSNTKRADSGAAEGARRATEQCPESGPLPGAGRWSAKRKTSVVLELLRGSDLESTSRKHRVTAATLSEWRERFLAGGEAMLKSRENDAEDEEIKRLKSVIAGVCVDNELLCEKITRLENGRLRDLEELRAALTEFRNRYNHQWILQRLNYRTPVQARHDFTLELQPAASFNESTYSNAPSNTSAAI